MSACTLICVPVSRPIHLQIRQKSALAQLEIQTGKHRARSGLKTKLSDVLRGYSRIALPEPDPDPAPTAMGAIAACEWSLHLKALALPLPE